MKMKLNNCKLKKNTQLRLLEYFVLEVTARSAANLLDIHPNTAALLQSLRVYSSYYTT
jgi:transposase